MLTRPQRLFATMALFVAVQIPVLDQPPNGFHTWRESDTAQIAENFAFENGNPLYPRINARGPSDGIVGSELPLYTYSVSLLYRGLDFRHLWPRLLSLLAALTAALAAGGVARRLDATATASELTVHLMLWSPLVAYYGVKIQPDMLGLALALSGFWLYLRHLDEPRPQNALGAALALGLAGGIKPTFLAVGLPMLGALVEKRGWAELKRPWPWLVALGTLALPALWLRHATALNEAFGEHYFYVGARWPEALGSLAEWSFYQNVFLTWPLELSAGGLALVAAALTFDAKTPVTIGRQVKLWMVGGLITCAMAAGHCATPHDYYYLTLVPPLALIAACTLDRILNQGRSGLSRGIALALVLLFPVYGWLRIYHRHEDRPGFSATRQEFATLIERATPVVAIDKFYGDVLYRAGALGWRLPLEATWKDVEELRALGARYLLALEKRPPSEDIRARLPAPVLQTNNLLVYPLSDMRQHDE